MGDEQMTVSEIKSREGKYLSFILTDGDYGIGMTPLAPVVDLRSRFGMEGPPTCIVVADVPRNGNQV